LRVDPQGGVEEFVEKPKEAEVIRKMCAPPGVFLSEGFRFGEDECLASMGVYVFNTDILGDCLSNASHTDFGKEIIPCSIGRRRVVAYPFTGYWRDIGTIRSFFEENIALAQMDPPFWLYAPGWPIYTRTRALPPVRVIHSEIRDSLLVEGSDIMGACITDSIIGVRSVIREGSRLNEVVLLGEDFYEGEQLLSRWDGSNGSLPPLGIGKDCLIERAIIDKNARIGDGVVIRARGSSEQFQGETHWVQDGITVIPKGTVIPPGTEL
jgi:glucose-1-phosphate adenylyltransferase